MAKSEGVDLEWAIVEMARGGPMTRRYSKKVLYQANKCVGHLIKGIGNKEFDIYHSDDKKIPGHSGGISGNPEPKTDIVVITKSKKKYYISVKMAGGIQLASGEGKSTAKLFLAASENIVDASKKKKIKELAESLEGMPTRLLSESNLKRILQSDKKKLIDEFTSNNKIKSSKSYTHWAEKEKPKLMGAIAKLATEDNSFFEALIFESMTGNQTLKGFSGAAANSVLSPSGFYMLDKTYINKIKNKVKIDIRAKSRSGITSIAFRIEIRGSL